MEALCRQRTFDFPPSTIRQWEFEEALNQLRRVVLEEDIRTHWQTRGITPIDARARAHIAEWLAIDGNLASSGRPPSIVDALVHRGLRHTPWDLYVVDGVGSKGLAIHRLHDHRGFEIRWLEGREIPAPGTTMGLRVMHLDPPGIDVATLPLYFGDNPGIDRLIAALLSAFGADGPSDWTTFMRGLGGRILLEYALSYLEEKSSQVEDSEPAAPLSGIFVRLETKNISGPERVALGDGRIAWLTDRCGEPQVMLFDCDADLRTYLNSSRGPKHLDKTVPWCRVYRATPEELSTFEATHFSTEPNGLLRVEKRHEKGYFVDPDEKDLMGLMEACQKLVKQRALGVA